MINVLNTTVCLDPLLAARGVTKDSNIRVSSNTMCLSIGHVNTA
jgi:hypothetical protein